MTTWTAYLLVYLAGIATPIFIVRQILSRNGDEGACFMDFLLGSIIALISLIVWVSIQR